MITELEIWNWNWFCYESGIIVVAELLVNYVIGWLAIAELNYLCGGCCLIGIFLWNLEFVFSY